MLLSGKVAVVTGSGLGLGRAYAIALAKAGAKVVVNSRTAGDVASVVDEIRHDGGDAEGCVANVATGHGAHRIIQTAIDKFQRVDILVNNAGILIQQNLLDVTEQDFDEVIAINLKGQFLCTKEAAPHMIRHKWGCIINMSSRSAQGMPRGGISYSASKAGTIGLSISCALELAEYGITCNAIRASALTRITQGLAERARQEALAVGSQPRFGPGWQLPPEAASPLVVFLSSDQGHWITGQFIGIDGTELTLYSSFRPVSVAFIPGGWTVELLLEHFKTTLGKQIEDYGPVDVKGERTM